MKKIIGGGGRGMFDISIQFIALSGEHNAYNTVNADIFAGLIFRVWQLKNIFAGC